MRAGANFLYFILGGFFLSASWFILALFAAMTIVLLPWARACFEIGKMSLHPFGHDVISIRELDGKSKPLSGILGFLCNLVWLPFGIYLAFFHVLHGVIMFCTIIGIPLGLQDFKLAGISLFPVGKRVVTKELVDAARKQNAKDELAKYRT